MPICFNHQGYYLITVNDIRILRCEKCGMVFADVNETTVEKTCKVERGKILTNYKLSPSNYFDVVYSHATFEHLYSPLKIAKELVRILKPGGMFITTGVPNYNTLSIKIFHNFIHNNPPGHINYFEIETMKYMYQNLGLEEIKISTYGINFWFLFHLLQKNRTQKILVQSRDISDEELIYQIKHETIDLDNLSISSFQKAMANIYCNARFPKMGVAVSGWGFKSL